MAVLDRQRHGPDEKDLGREQEEHPGGHRRGPELEQEAVRERPQEPGLQRVLQRALPGLQHQPGGRAAVPEAGRPRAARRLRGRHVVRRGAQRRPRLAVPVAGREVLPDPVEAEPGDDLLQQELSILLS